jgi:hypothetical protein
VGDGLDGREYAELAGRAAETLTVPVERPRRDGSATAIAGNIEAARRDLRYVLSQAGDVAHIQPLCLELASCLYDAGAPHRAWRFWSGLAGLGLVLSDRPADACAYLVLAEQWDSVGALTSGPAPAGGPLPRRAVWALAAGTPLDPDPVDDVDRPWTELADAVPIGDHKQASRALRDLADFWIGEDEDWNTFAPRSYPSFEPEVCAAAAIARRHGITPAEVPDDVMLFLEPGLGIGTPTGLPTLSPR